MHVLKRVSALYTIITVFGVAAAGTAVGTEGDPAVPLPSGSQSGDTAAYEYPINVRSDPFVPFLSPESSQIGPDPNEIIEEDKILTGMQLFEPGQLDLVAILETGDDRIAMAQDVSGKGYILKTGMLIGRRGMIQEINDLQVIIEERAVTRAGKEILSTVTMNLKKEGDD